MREFDKWLKKQLPYDPFCCAGMSEAAWRAALKWAKAMHDISSEPRFAVNIREELKE